MAGIQKMVRERTRLRRGKNSLLKFLIGRLVERTCDLIQSIFNLIKEFVAFNATHHMLHFNVAQRVCSAPVSP